MNSKIIQIIISFLLFLLIFSVVFEITAFDEKLQTELIEKYSKRENKVEEQTEVLDFFETGNLSLNLTPLEKSHMNDVRNLNQKFKIFIIILMIIVSVLIIINKQIHEILFKLWIPLLTTILITGVIYLFPNFSFEIFHKIFFPQGNYTFTYNSLLISLYPQEYFFELFYTIMLRTILLIIPLIIIGYYLKKKIKI